MNDKIDDIIPHGVNGDEADGLSGLLSLSPAKSPARSPPLHSAAAIAALVGSPSPLKGSMKSPASALKQSPMMVCALPVHRAPTRIPR